ncbi:MAG: ACT domain-containing protein, partial [Geminicoccaceae bacterium]
PGTLVVDEGEILEQQVVSGIAYSRDEAKVTLIGVSDQPGIAARIFGPLAESGINVDMIVQSVSADGSTTDLTFTVGRADLERARAILEAMQSDLGFLRMSAKGDVVKISVIGVGMRSHAGIAHVMFQALAERDINVQAISTSEIKISILIDEDYTELALRTLHTTYGLDEA